MAVPKKRTSKTKRNMRRSHHGMSVRLLSNCPRCQVAIASHRACPNCGFYRGREVIDVASIQERGNRRRRAKAQATGR